MPGADDLHRTLSETAASYLALGWSVVPLWGDSRPEHAKVPAVSWSAYQRRRAGEQDITRWFSGTPYTGLGIVTGSISQLVVLDFDDAVLADRFAAQCSELTDTRTVCTRRGQHLYFRIPAYLRIPSRKLAGVDLLSDGCYVVAPPTTIDGHAYTVEQGGLPKLLTSDDVLALNAFLDRTAAERPKARVRPTAAEPVVKTQVQAFSYESESFLTAEALVALYRGLAGQSGRNAALFKAACLARDHGWKREAVMAVLGQAHVQQPTRTQQRPEKPQARHREAERTVRSAFSKPARPLPAQDKGGLFNSIREALLQLKLTCVVRVLEGLHKVGLIAGQLVSERELVAALKNLVGRHSIRQTLAATTPAGKALFKPVRSPRHPPHCDAASHRHRHGQKNAYVNETKPDSIRGRRETRYRIPSAEALCQRLGVAPSGSDPVALDDLKSAKTTRQALQRGLIARRPGTYLRKWLADRLGVSERTLSRYNRTTPGLNVTPTFTQTPLGWANLNAIPRPDAAPPGTCLEDSTGKRWPAVKGIAQKLLGQGRGVRLLVRSLNYYWTGNGDPPVDGRYQVQRALDVTPEQVTAGQVVTLAQQVARLVRSVGGPTERPPGNVLTEPVPPPPVAPPSANPAPVMSSGYAKRKRRHYGRPLSDPALEQLAARVYTRANARTADPEHRLSLASARAWVDRYGARAVEGALDVFERRPHVTAPAGFLATLLRSSAVVPAGNVP